MKAAEKIPVVRRLYPSLMKRWARLTWTGGHKVKRYNGLLLLNWHNYVDRHVGLFGGYERGRHVRLHREDDLHQDGHRGA